MYVRLCNEQYKQKLADLSISYSRSQDDAIRHRAESRRLYDELIEERQLHRDAEDALSASRNINCSSSSMMSEFICHKADDHILLMTIGGEGICSVSIDANVKSCACIYNLNTEATRRKQGYGNRLLKHAEHMAKMLGASVVSLAVKNGSFMYDWYQRCGYKPIFSDDEFVTMYKELL